MFCLAIFFNSYSVMYTSVCNSSLWAPSLNSFFYDFSFTNIYPEEYISLLLGVVEFFFWFQGICNESCKTFFFCWNIHMFIIKCFDICLIWNWSQRHFCLYYFLNVAPFFLQKTSFTIKVNFFFNNKQLFNILPHFFKLFT